MELEEISILIVEDEEIWSTSLAGNLRDFGFTIAGIADNFEDAVTALNNTSYDIALLDINLNNRNSGIELGKMIHQFYRKPFIFITASHHGHSSADAFAAHPSAYLIKPVNPTSLFISIQNAIRNFQDDVTAQPSEEEGYDSFFVKQGIRYKKIDWKNVVYLSSEKKYTGVFNAGDQTEYFIRSTLPKTMSYIIPKGLQKKFVQVNRSEVLNTSYVTEISGESVNTAFKTFNVTPAYIKELKDRLHILG